MVVYRSLLIFIIFVVVASSGVADKTSTAKGLGDKRLTAKGNAAKMKKDLTIKKIWDCRQRTFLSDMLLETCVRRELSVTWKKNAIARGNFSQLAQYTQLWAKCAETTLDTSCNTSRTDVSRSRKITRLHMVRLWSNMDKLICAWENNKNATENLSTECIDSLMTSSGRKCLPIITTRTSGYGDLRTTEDFISCVKLETKSCYEAAQSFFIHMIQKNLKFRITLAEHDNLLMKECIQVLNKTKLDICAPGLYDMLDSLAFETLIIQKNLTTPFTEPCLNEELELCSPKAIDVISEVSDTFLNVSLSDASDLLMRTSSEKKPFNLMPEDVLEIKKCLAVSDKKKLDYCLPGLYRSLLYITNQRPLKNSVLRMEMKGTGCLGVAFQECSGSTRYIIRRVYYGLYGVTLDIPFDTNSIVSPPGLYEQTFMDIMYPPYNISGEILNELAKCVQNLALILSECCKDMLGALYKIMSNKLLPFPVLPDNDCTESCYKHKMSDCSEKGAVLTGRLIYSVRLLNLQFKDYGISHIPSSPPYNFPERRLQEIDGCIDMVDTDKLEEFCPGIFEVLKSIRENAPMPNKRIPQEICTYANLLQITVNCDMDSALSLQVFFNFLFRMYEESLSSMEQFYFRVPESNETLQMRSYSKQEQEAISRCLRDNKEEMEACCPSLFSVIATSILNVPTLEKENQLRWCSKFCYEPFVFNCDKSLMMMHLINSVINSDRGKELKVRHLVLFPRYPPYNLPDYVSGPISLCLNMMKSVLQECCPAMVLGIEAILSDELWNPENTCYVRCDYKCYEKAVEKCFKEGGDLTMGVILSLQHCRETYDAMKRCFNPSKDSFGECCPDVANAIDSIYTDKPFLLNETKIGRCDIPCLVKSIKNCPRQDTDIIQKVTKYIMDYSLKESYPEFKGKIFTTKEVQIVSECFEEMEPLLNECCLPVKASVYTVLNGEEMPVDGPNLKRCHHFCFEMAPRQCPNDSVPIVSALISHVVSKPAPGPKEFGEACRTIIQDALGCCDLMVQSIYEVTPVSLQTNFASRRCRYVCREKLIKDCIYFTNRSYDVIALINNHFGSSNAALSEKAMKSMAYELEGLKDSNNEAPQFEFVEFPSKRQLRSDDLLTFGNTAVIAPLLRERTRLCVNLVKKEELDKCWPGFYEFLLYLYNGILQNTMQYKTMAYVCECLEEVLHVCPIDSRVVIKTLTQKYLNVTLDIFSHTKQVEPVGPIDEEARRAIKSCVHEANKDGLDKCLDGFWDVFKDVIKTGKSYRKIVLKNKECVKEIFGVCNMRGKLEIIKMIYNSNRILLEIPIDQDISRVNFLKLLSANDQSLIRHCMNGVTQRAADECLEGLYQVLTGIGREDFDTHLKLSDRKHECLGNLFGHCSMHVKLLISDLLKLAGGTTVEIRSPAAKNFQILSNEETTFLPLCFKELDQDVLWKYTPELFELIAAIAESRIPDTNSFPVKIYNTSCHETMFKKCSAEARMILTDLTSQYTNGFSSLLFPVDENRTIDDKMMGSVNECLALVPEYFLDGCLKGLRRILNAMKNKFLVESRELSLDPDALETCPKEIFADCSVYQRLLMDELLRRIPHRFNETLMFEILHPMRLDAGMHRHTFSDEIKVKDCFQTVNKKSMDYCVPGLYEMLDALVRADTNVPYFATRPIQAPCLSTNFAKCTYYTRILIKDLLFDYYRLNVEMPLEDSPESVSVSVGPLDGLLECVSRMNIKEVNRCFPGIAATIRKTHIFGQPKLSPGIKADVLKCLANALKCKVGTTVYILNNIAIVNNLNITMTINESEDKEAQERFDFSVIHEQPTQFHSP